jgi:hypothetical protein
MAVSVSGEDVEAEGELVRHLFLSLLDGAARHDDQAALKITPNQQLLDQQSRHDCLAGAGIVGEQDAQWLARQHLAIDGRDLMRQRLYLGGGDRQIGIELTFAPRVKSSSR